MLMRSPDGDRQRTPQQEHLRRTNRAATAALIVGLLGFIGGIVATDHFVHNYYADIVGGFFGAVIPGGAVAYFGSRRA